MSRFGIGGGSGPKQPRVGSVDRTEALKLLQREELGKLGQAMRREGHPPDAIEAAVRGKNAKGHLPLADDALEALVADFTADYVPQTTRVSLAGFMRETYPQPQFVVDQLIPRDEVTLGGGHGGSGKSILFLALAVHVACGKEWDDFRVEKGRVVFVTLEDPATHVMYRLQKITREYMLSPEEVAEVERNLIVIDGTGYPELMIEVSEYGTHSLLPTQTMREIEQAVTGASLIVIDNVSDAFGGNENERRGVRTFVRHFAAIARAQGAGVVLLAHIDKAAARNGAKGNSYSGSTAWHNSTRSRLALVDVDGQLQLHHEKFNRSRQAEPVYLTWTEDGVLIPGNSSTAVAARSQRAQEEKNAALRAMLAALVHGIRVPGAASGNATSWHALEHLPEMEPFRGADGKRQFHAALIGLQTDSLLAQIEYRNDQRKTRKAWELTAMGEAAARRLAQ